MAGLTSLHDVDRLAGPGGLAGLIVFLASLAGPLPYLEELLFIVFLAGLLTCLVGLQAFLACPASLSACLNGNLSYRNYCQ